MAIVNGYVMQKYEGTDEYHLYNAKCNEETGKITVNPKTPLCGDDDVSYDRANKLAFKEIKTEDEMVKICANQEASVRHEICAKCVGWFYRTC